MEPQKFIACLPIFKDLEPEILKQLTEKFVAVRLADGATLFRQGDPGDALYILEKGKLHVSVQTDGEGQRTINELGIGECIGEMALLTGQPRTATVTAVEPCGLLCLPRSAFDEITKQHPEILSGMASQLLPRYHQLQASQALTHLFGKLDEVVLQQLMGKLGWRKLESGEVLFHHGDPGDEMFIVVQGRLRFSVDEPGAAPRMLGEVGAGECIGEFVLLAEKGSAESLRSATVYATRQTDLLCISRATFEDLLCQFPQALLNLSHQIVRRAVSTNQAFSKPTGNTVIAVIADTDCFQGRCADQLTDAIQQHGPALFLSAAKFEAHYGIPGAANTPLDAPTSVVINAWLDDREREHRFTIYDAAPVTDQSGKLSSWAKRCLEDADLILLMVDEAADPTRLDMLGRALEEACCCSRMELAVMHPAGCRIPYGTSALLAKCGCGKFPIQAVHHIRMGHQPDFQRMARRIAGHPIGLTLSGGGARGWAHVGVLRALEDIGLEFDWVAGASMGAIVAAGIGLDYDSKRLVDLAERFSDPKKLLDYTLPYTSITATRRITAVLKEQFRGADIEDTWHPFFCVSADLTHGCERLHTSGPLWKAVRASMAFPGIFAPVCEEGSVLIDGGAANNLPIDRMRERCPGGTVIGVDLLTGSPVGDGYDFPPYLSGWQTLFGRLFPFNGRKKIPNMLNIIDGLVYSNNRYRLNESYRKADLLIKVPVAMYGLLQFDRYQEIIEAGYIAAQDQLKDLRIAL